MFPAVADATHMRTNGVLWRGWLPVSRGRRIELSVHCCFPATLVAVTWLLAMACFPRFFPGWHPAAYWLVATTVALADSVAGLAHELGHAAVAMALGRQVYRITLYGLAAAVRRTSGAARPCDQFAIALAGPVSHLLVACALLCAWNVLPIDNEPLRVATGFPAASNFAAGLLNLVPISPLDGARVARALITGLVRV